MSRREGRDSDSKRHLSSRLDRDRSPKRTRRDGKPEAGRIPRNSGTDVAGHTDRDQRHLHRKQDALAVETTSVPDSKAETASVNKEFALKPNGYHQGANSKAPYLQHDERGNAGQVGRSSSRKSSNERGWRDSRDWRNEREANKSAGHDTHPRGGKPEAKEFEKNVWRHDKFQEREADLVPPSRKRPAFREKKIVDPEPSDKAPMEPVITNRSDHSAFGSEKLEERDHKIQHLDKLEKSYGGDRVSSRGEAPRGGFPPRERYAGGGGSYGGRDRYGGRQGYHPSGGRVEKWKHDLFHEANRSPTPKNEEDQIAKVEALLAS